MLQNDYAQAGQIAEDDPRSSPARPRSPDAAGTRAGQRLPRAAEGRRAAGGRRRHPREPRTEPAHRGRDPPPRGGGLPGARPRHPEPAGRHAGGRGQGARPVRDPRPRPDRRAPGGRRAYLASRPDSTGRVGAIGFCWGGGIVNWLAAAGTVLSAPSPSTGDPARERRPRGPRAAAPALRGQRRAGERRVAGVRGGAKGPRSRYRAVRLRRRRARLQQRHQRRALQRSRGEPRVGTDDRVPAQAARRGRQQRQRPLSSTSALRTSARTARRSPGVPRR